MDTTWKNRLQEYCQKQKISLPNYRIKKQLGQAHCLKFQAEVEIDNHWYVGDESCSSKKEAEQSAARQTWETLLAKDVCSAPQLLTAVTSKEHPDLQAPSSAIVEFDSLNHLPDEYTAIEQFIDTKVKQFGGRIRKISSADRQGYHKFEINGSYRYCENIKRHHKKNQIYFIVHPITKTYFQKCHDPECYGFRSASKSIVNEQKTSTDTQEDKSTNRCSKCQTSFESRYRNTCERCGKLFCRKCVRTCDLCHDAMHCETCFELCFDCHD